MSEFSSFAAAAATAGSTFPPVLGVDALSLLINKSPATILMDRSRAPHKLPPACMPPGTKQPLWLTADVLEWLASHREVREKKEPTKREPQSKQSKLGAPTKVERAEADRLGLSVRELRAQRALELGGVGGRV